MPSQREYEKKRVEIKDALVLSVKMLSMQNPCLYFPQNHIVRKYNQIKNLSLPSLRREPTDPKAKAALTELVEEARLQYVEIAQLKREETRAIRFYKAKLL